MMVALDAAASATSFSVMPPTRSVHERQFHIFTLQLAQAFGHGLERALDIGFHHHVERGGLASLDLSSKMSSSLAAPAGRRGAAAHVGAAEALLAALFGPRRAGASGNWPPLRSSVPGAGKESKPRT